MLLSRISWCLLNMIKVRRPAVAGYFYPGERDSLESYLTEIFIKYGPGYPESTISVERKILGIIAPHAGYMYSGWVASYAYYEVAKDGLPRKIILIGPNHTGLGTAISIYPSGFWETPLGNIKVDEEIVNYLSSYDELISIDEMAHLQEHSLEVHIPFIQFISKSVKADISIVPIVMMLQNFEAIRVLGESILKAFRNNILRPEETLIIASTDFTHYESAKQAEKKDKLAFESILNLDPSLLLETVYTYNITMCGYGPVGTLLYIAKELGDYKVTLLKYGNSGNVTGDYSSIVSYASFKIHK